MNSVGRFKVKRINKSSSWFNFIILYNILISSVEVTWAELYSRELCIYTITVIQIISR